MTTKEQFLIEHNSLSSPDKRATMELLICFKLYKPALFKGGDYSIEKIRRPFICWLTSLSKTQKIKLKKSLFKTKSTV